MPDARALVALLFAAPARSRLEPAVFGRVAGKALVDNDSKGKVSD